MSLGSKEAAAQLTGLSVQAGQVGMTNPSATSTLITQTTSKAILNWQSFSIAGGTSVQFKQPGPGSIALNRVLGGNVSNIAGQLSANGQVWIVNPSGVFFGGGAQVNVGGLLATTADIQNSDFMAGNYKFGIPGNPNASVINQGNIQVASGGSVVLAGAHVSNEGLIQADLGTVVLGGAKTFAIDFQGDKLLSFQVSAPVDQTPANADGTPVSALVSNGGTISAAGGTVILTARAAKNVIDNVINSSGIVQATTASMVNGEIVLDGGTVGAVTVTGSLDASGKSAGETGGTIKVLGDQVALGSTAALDASGDAGGGTVLVGGNFHGAGPEQNATSTTITAGSAINANAITTGNGGQVAIWSEQSTGFDGAVSVNGGSVSGNGGMVETSSRNNLSVGGTVSASAAHGSAGTWLLDPVNITVVAGNGALERDDGTTTTSGGTQTINVTGDNDSDDAGLTIGADRISSELSGGTNVILKSAGNIFISPSVSITDTFAGSSGVSLTLSASPSSGGITFGNEVSVSATSSAGPLFVSLLGGSSIVLGSGDAIITRGGGVSFNKQVVLGTSSGSTGTVSIDTTRASAAAGAINFASTIDDATGAAVALALNGGAVSFGGSVGSTTTLAALQVTGTTTLAGSTYRATGDENFTGPTTLLTDSTLTSSNGNISFVGTASTINGAHALSLNAATGTVSLGGSVGNAVELTSLAIDPVSITLGGSTYHTSGGQTYSEAVTLAVSTGLTSDSGSVIFAKTIDGAQTLSVAAGQTVEVDGLIGSSVALAALNISGKTVTLNGIDRSGSAGVSGAVNVTGSNAITLGEGTYHSGGTQAYTGPVALTADTTMTSDSADLSFVGTQSTIDGAHALSLQAAAGTVSLGGSVGGTVELSSLLVDPVGITLGGAVYRTVGDQTYSQAVTLGADTSLTSDTGSIAFKSTIDGAQSLTATANQAIEMDGVIGGGTSLTALTLHGNTVQLDGIGGAGVGVSGTVAVTGGGISLSGTTYHGGSDQTYAGPVALLADTSVTSEAGNVTFTGTIDGAHALSVAASAGAVAVDGLIGGGTALTSLDINGAAVTLTGIGGEGDGVTGAISVTGTGGITLNEGTYRSDGTQAYNGAATLGADTVVTSDSGNIAFTSTIDGAHALSLQAAAGTVSLGGSVGTTIALTSLLVDPIGIVLGGAAYHTVGDQTYSQAVTLGANTALTSDTGNILFASTVDGGGSLTATASQTINVGGLIGGSTALAALSLTGNAVTLNGIGGEGAGVTGAVSVTATNGIALNGGTYHSGSGQTYGGAVTLLADAAITSDAGGVHFTGTIDGAHAFSATANQGISIDGLIGNNTALTSLILAGQSVVLNGIDHSGEIDSAGVTGMVSISGAGGITLNVGTYHSGGNQLYSGAVLLGTDTTFISDTGGITVTGALTGAHNLAIVDGGADSFASVNLGNTGILHLTGKTAGSFTAQGSVTAASLVTGSNPYSLNLLGGATIGDPTFANTGGIALAGVFLFTDGFTTGQTITLGGGTEINTETSGITLGTVNQGTFEFIVIADTFAFNGPWNGTGPRGITPFSNLSIGVGDAPGQWTLNQQTLELLADPPELVMIGGGVQIAQELNAVLTGQAPFIPSGLPGPINLGNFTFNAPVIFEGSSINLNGTVTQTAPNTGVGFISSGAISGPGSLALGPNTGPLIIAGPSTNLTGVVNGNGGAGAANNTTLILQLGPGPFIINGVCFAGPACITGLRLTPQFEAVVADLLNNGNGGGSTAPETPTGPAGGGGEGGLGGISPAAGGDSGTDASFDALTQPLTAKTASQATPKVQGYYVSLLGNLLYEWRQLARLGRGANVPEENNDFSSWGNEARW